MSFPVPWKSVSHSPSPTLIFCSIDKTKQSNHFIPHFLRQSLVLCCTKRHLNSPNDGTATAMLDMIFVSNFVMSISQNCYCYSIRFTLAMYMCSSCFFALTWAASLLKSSKASSNFPECSVDRLPGKIDFMTHCTVTTHVHTQTSAWCHCAKPGIYDPKYVTCWGIFESYIGTFPNTTRTRSNTSCIRDSITPNSDWFRAAWFMYVQNSIEKPTLISPETL